MTKITRLDGFFVVRSKGAQGLGRSWPEGAVASFAHDRVCLIADRLQPEVRHGDRVDAAILDAADRVESSRAKSVMVAKMVGRFGNANLYERVAVIGEQDPKERDLFARKDYGADCKTFHAKITKIDGVKIEGFASTPELDRDYDIVEPTAFAASIAAFLANPQLLYNHDFDRNVGLVESVDFRKDGVFVRASVMDPQLADWCKTGRIRMFSVQFRIAADGYTWEEIEVPGVDENGGAIKRKVSVRRITKGELLEISLVTVPANRTAAFELSKALKDGTDLRCTDCGASNEFCSCAETAAVMDHRTFDVAAEGEEVEESLTKIAALLGTQAADHAVGRKTDSGHRFQHHAAAAGDLKLVPGLLRCAMATLVGGDAAKSMTWPERERLWKHLARHYGELKAEAPKLSIAVEEDRFAGIAFPPGGSEDPIGLCLAKSKCRTEADARAWAKSHGFAVTRVEERGSAFECSLVAGPTSFASQRTLDEGVFVAVRKASSSAASRGAAVQKGSTMGMKSGAAPEDPPAAGTTDTPAAPPAAPAADPPAKGGTPAPEPDETVELEASDAATLDLLSDPDADLSSVTPEQIDRAVAALEPHLDG